MRDRLLHHYEQELRFLRRMAGEFAEAHPDVASALQLGATRCDDPHVERLIEACAMLAARVQLRLDDDLCEVSQALLGLLYPHYLAPIPSLAIVQLEVDPEGAAVAGGVPVPRHTMLHAPPPPGRRTRPRFRTAYSLRLWPLTVQQVELVPRTPQDGALPPGVRSAVRIRLRAPQGVSIAQLRIDALRFFLPGEGGSTPPLYELLLRDPRGLRVQCGERSRLLGPEHVRAVGFELDEGVLEYPPTSNLAYRLLQEYFAFPEKLQFVELSGLDQLPLGDERSGELVLSVLLEESPSVHREPLSPEDLRLGCTPAVNLFEHRAEPIRLDHLRSEHEVIPDVRAPGDYEVYAIRRVRILRPGDARVRELSPLYGLRHGDPRASSQAGYWHGVRRASLNEERAASRLYLSLVDHPIDPRASEVDTLTVETLCTNADLCQHLELGPHGSELQVEGQDAIRRVHCLRRPTPSLPAPVSLGSQWRLVSHLALSYLSLSGDGAGPDGTGQRQGIEALRELLVLYDFADSAITQGRIRGLVGVQSKRVLRRIGRGAQAGLVRGLCVQLELDPQQYTGAGAFLLASVLERFLGQYTSVQSFTQTVATLRGREGVQKRWPPRSGRAVVL